MSPSHEQMYGYCAKRVPPTCEEQNNAKCQDVVQVRVKQRVPAAAAASRLRRRRNSFIISHVLPLLAIHVTRLSLLHFLMLSYSLELMPQSNIHIKQNAFLIYMLHTWRKQIRTFCFLTDPFSGPVEQSFGYVCVCVCVCVRTISFELNGLDLGILVQLGTILIKFECQGQNSKFIVTGGKTLIKWSVRPRVRAFY